MYQNKNSQLNIFHVAKSLCRSQFHHHLFFKWLHKIQLYLNLCFHRSNTHLHKYVHKSIFFCLFKFKFSLYNAMTITVGSVVIVCGSHKCRKIYKCHFDDKCPDPYHNMLQRQNNAIDQPQMSEFKLAYFVIVFNCVLLGRYP